MKCLVWGELKCSKRFVFKISRIAINSVYLWYKMHERRKYSIIKCKISQIKEIREISRRSHLYFVWSSKAFVFRSGWDENFNFVQHTSIMTIWLEFLLFCSINWFLVTDIEQLTFRVAILSSNYHQDCPWLEAIWNRRQTICRTAI